MRPVSESRTTQDCTKPNMDPDQMPRDYVQRLIDVWFAPGIQRPKKPLDIMGMEELRRRLYLRWRVDTGQIGGARDGAD